MRTALICTTPPAVFVTKAEVKAQLNIASGDVSKDTMLDALIDAACGYLEGADGSTKRAIASQDWTLVLPSFKPDGCGFPYRIELPLPPTRAVSSITYFDQAGDQQTLDAANYRLVNRGADRSRVVPVTSWPSTYCRDDAVSIAFTAGYGTDAGQVPMPKQLKQAVIWMVKQFYDLDARNVFLASESVDGVAAKSYFAEGSINMIKSTVDNLLFDIRLRG
jgi:uncharacterized phiE125 gp8 family phage protein